MLDGIADVAVALQMLGRQFPVLQVGTCGSLHVRRRQANDTPPLRNAVSMWPSTVLPTASVKCSMTLSA